MNTRSLKFQLMVWYGALLTGSFALIGLVTYIAFRSSLVGAIEESQLRRVRQVCDWLQDASPDAGVDRVARQIEELYTPSQAGRFIRISRGDGLVVYLSPAPADRSFDPAGVPSVAWPARQEDTRRVDLSDGRQMLVGMGKASMRSGPRFLVETGVPLDTMEADLHKWLLFLAAMLPVVAAVALGGGYFLVKRALSPVDRITASAERISSQNLAERLPVAHTGDELERLSVALNHMIERLDAALRHSHRFVADASHELRTPLTVLRGELEELVQEPNLTAEWRERLGSALEEVERLATIVEGLFAISRLDAGEAAAEWAKFDLGQLAAATADQMSLLAEDKKILVTCTAAKGVCVEGDRSRMKQVVVNLLDNAIKYTLAGGEVNLTVSNSNGNAVLEVADNGIGIPPEAVSRVFERFFRVDQARSREQGGAGLGLSIVKSICTAHRGRVEVTSQPGQGTRFHVELPLAASQNGSLTDATHP